MLFMKLAFITCVVYLGLNFLMYATFIGLVREGVIVGIHFSHRVGVFVFFGVIWLVSFSGAWRIVMAPLLARHH